MFKLKLQKFVECRAVGIACERKLLERFVNRLPDLFEILFVKQSIEDKLILGGNSSDTSGKIPLVRILIKAKHHSSVYAKLLDQLKF